MVFGIRKIEVWRRFKSKKPNVIESRNMRKYEKALFRSEIQQLDWEAILTPFGDNPANLAATFQEVFESILDYLQAR